MHPAAAHIGIVRLKKLDYLPNDQRITQMTIGEHAGCWFVSVLVEKETPASTGNVTEEQIDGMTLSDRVFVCEVCGQYNGQRSKRYPQSEKYRGFHGNQRV